MTEVLQQTTEGEIAWRADNTGEQVPDKEWTVQNGQARAAVRERGGYITECQLVQPDTDQLVQIMYCDPDHTKAKMNGSHPMSPAGQSKGLGGQHGPARWADFGVINKESSSIQLRTESIQGHEYGRELHLQESALEVRSRVHNTTDHAYHTSLGEHFYFALGSEDQLDGLRIKELADENYTRITDLPDAPTVEEFTAGTPFVWQGFSGQVEIEFPDGKRLTLDSRIAKMTDSGNKRELQVDWSSFSLWLWHRKDTSSFCFEPVVGARKNEGGDSYNDGLVIPPRSSVELRTTVGLVA